MTAALACPITGSTDTVPLARQNGHDWFLFPASGVAMVALLERDESEAAFQDTHADDYIAGYARKPSKARRSLKRARLLRRLAPGPRLLDVGSNVGIFCAAAREAGFTPEGLEISATLCAHARAAYPDIPFHDAALEDFEPPHLYDAVYCSEVIEHAVDPRDFARRLHALLAPGGVLYLTTPDLDEYLEHGRPFRDLGAPDHKVYFNRRNIGPFLHGLGFGAIDLSTSFKLRRKHRTFGLRGGLKLTCRKPS